MVVRTILCPCLEGREDQENQPNHAICGSKVCAVYKHQLPSGDKGYLHWGRVVAVRGSERTVKWQTDKQLTAVSASELFPKQLLGLLLTVFPVLTPFQTLLVS